MMHFGDGGTYAGRCESIAGELLGEVAGGPSATDREEDKGAAGDAGPQVE
jgi:hypothetical protein